ncbi:hypothetical protein PMAYCL1PPCAC_08799, partial [Pristionchus mayeri]
RIIPAGRMVACVYDGPCALHSSFLCHCLFVLALACYSQSIYLIAASFGYRLYVLKRNSPSTWQVLLVCVVLALCNLPSLILFILLPDDPDAVRRAINFTRPEYNLDHYAIEGKLNIFEPRMMVAISAATLPNLPVLICICVLRRKVMTEIGEQSSKMSAITMKLHSALAKVLSLQTLLPISFSFSIFIYILCQSDTIYSPTIEHFISEVGLPVPLLSPVITLFFVQPYRAIRSGEDFMQSPAENIVRTVKRVNL